ncbi:hypothetical protein SLS60_009540 [Paraconiothyrium brasiliense]|uniref:Zn(2)-C6 fungal-type domain-containing protein n=1 Tax=Paraconiothyrium brasiliense TaxID=300254 RepID=A0ABR3QUM8_9PLEO
MSATGFRNDMPPQYPSGDASNFVEFVNEVHASATAAQAIKHVDLTPSGYEVAPISSLLVHSTWDTTMDPASVKLVYDSGLSEAALKGLKDNGFETWLVYALQKAHTIGEELNLSMIPENQLLLLHVYAIAPCKNITMLTVPSQWYARTGKEFKQELQSCLPELDLGLRESNEDRTVVRIGGRSSQSVSNSADPIQSADNNRHRMPRCLRCKSKKFGCDRRRPCERCAKVGLGFDDCIPEDESNRHRMPRCLRCKAKKFGCDRKRPCERCAKVGLGFDDCIPEDESNSRDGFYGGSYTKGPEKKSQNAEPDQAAADGNGASSTEYARGDETIANPENLEDDEADEAADDNGGDKTFFERVNQYLGNSSAMGSFLKLYEEHVMASRGFEEALTAATRFFDGQGELFAELQRYLRGEEDVQELNFAYENFLMEHEIVEEDP